MTDLSGFLGTQEGDPQQAQPTPGPTPAPPGTPGQGSEAPPPAPQQQQAPVEPDYSLASDFLQRVDEADRATVEKYVKQWDAGVTRRFQELHGKYQPYEALGDPEDLQQALQVMRLLDESPEIIYNILMEDVQKGADWAKGLGQPQQQQNFGGGPSGEESPFQGLPPEIAAQIQSQQTMLEQLAQIVVGTKQAEIEAQEDAALDEYLTNLKTEFGDFDEEYVLARMEKGEDGATAVASFNAMIQARVNGAFTPQQDLPPILSGGGAPPSQQQKVQELDTKSTRNLVAGILSQTAQANQ